MSKRSKDPLNIHYLRYSKNAFGSNEWMFVGRDIIATIEYNYRKITLCIPICTYPEAFRFPIRRVSDSLWYISPTRYIPEDRNYIAKREDFDPGLSSTFLALLGAPDSFSPDR